MHSKQQQLLGGDYLILAQVGIKSLMFNLSLSLFELVYSLIAVLYKINNSTEKTNNLISIRVVEIELSQVVCALHTHTHIYVREKLKNGGKFTQTWSFIVV